MDLETRMPQVQAKQAELDEADLFYLQGLSELTRTDELEWNTALGIVRRRMRRVLGEAAQRIADEFWGVQWKHRTGDGVEMEYGGYGCRVMHRDWTIYINWYYLESKGKNGKKTTPVSPPKGVRLSKSSFPKAKDWELEAIMKAEEGFGKIRRCAEKLENIRLEVYGFTQILNALHTGEEVDLPPPEYMEMFAPT